MNIEIDEREMNLLLRGLTYVEKEAMRSIARLYNVDNMEFRLKLLQRLRDKLLEVRT